MIHFSLWPIDGSIGSDTHGQFGADGRNAIKEGNIALEAIADRPFLWWSNR